MTKHHSLGVISEIPCGEGRNYRVGDRMVAVFHTRDGQLYATQANCPHRQGPLADGLTGGGTLVCPLHEWSFDLATGKALNGQCSLTIYPVARGPGDEVLLEVPSENDH